MPRTSPESSRRRDLPRAVPVNSEAEDSHERRTHAQADIGGPADRRRVGREPAAAVSSSRPGRLRRILIKVSSAVAAANSGAVTFPDRSWCGRLRGAASSCGLFPDLLALVSKMTVHFGRVFGMWEGKPVAATRGVEPGPGRERIPDARRPPRAGHRGGHRAVWAVAGESHRPGPGLPPRTDRTGGHHQQRHHRRHHAAAGVLARVGATWSTGRRTRIRRRRDPAAALGALLNQRVAKPVLLLSFAALTVLAAAAMILDSRTTTTSHGSSDNDDPGSRAERSATEGARCTSTCHPMSERGRGL